MISQFGSVLCVYLCVFGSLGLVCVCGVVGVKSGPNLY